MNYEILSLRTAKKLKQQEIEINRLNDILDELEKDLGNMDECKTILQKVQKLRSGE